MPDPKRIHFYYDHLKQPDLPQGGGAIATLAWCEALARLPEKFVVSCSGDHIHQPISHRGVECVMLPSLPQSEQFLSAHEIVVFGDKLGFFSQARKPTGQKWILILHSWEVLPGEVSRIRDFDAIVCLSAAHRNAFALALRRQGIEHPGLFAIPNFIDMSVTPVVREQRERKLLYVGALVPHKQVEILLGALAILNQNGLPYTLDVVGSSKLWNDPAGEPYEAELKKVAPPTAVFHGILPRPAIASFYDESSFLVSASRWETFGLSAVEAQLRGCLPILHNAGGVSAVVNDGVCGLLYGPNTPLVVAQTVLRGEELIARDPKVRIKAQRFVVENFSPEGVVPQFLKLIDGLFATPLIVNTELQPNPASRSKPLFSILMPTYNQAHFVAEAIESVRNQTCSNWELVITNDGSTDGTADLIAKYAALDSRIKVFNKINGGTGSALNNSLREAQGEWITWLSSDDRYEPTALETFAQGIRQSPTTRAFHANYTVLYHEENRSVKNIVSPECPLPNQAIQLLGLLSGNFINGITICISRSVFNEVGCFNERNRCGQDYEMWLQVAKRTPWQFLDSYTSVTRLHILTGAISFPDDGILDSARAAVEFVNATPYAKLFPMLDLSVPDQARMAVAMTLVYVVNPESFLYKSIGQVPLLLRRLVEWKSSEATPALWEQIHGNLVPLFAQVRAAPLGRRFAPELDLLFNPTARNVSYQPVDERAAMLMFYEQLRATEPEASEKFAAYLKKRRLIEGSVSVEGQMPSNLRLSPQSFLM
jgi:glycosyltransferase involved in cell wall biosynthesis